MRVLLSRLNIWLNRAAKKTGFMVGVDDFGLGKVRRKITSPDMEAPQ